MDWNDFAMRLTLELSRLPVTSFVIVQGPSGLPYVQAMRSEGLFDAEAVGSAFLPRPLAPRQERRLRALGWEPPDEEERKNWWQQFILRDHRDRRGRRDRRDRRGQRDRDDRVTAEHLEASALLAGLIVGAFRDAYHIESPLELVYQASRSGPEGGPLALPGLGIPLALPESENGSATRPDGPSTFGLETALAEARERGDQHGYLDLLARAVLYLPAPGDAGAADHQFATARFGDGTFVLAFTSPEAMDHSLQGQAAHHREASLAELARGWPHPEWRLAINPGLPSASYLDASSLLEPAEPARSQAVGSEAPSEPSPGDSGAVLTAPRPPESLSPPPAEPRVPSGVPEASEALTSPLGAPAPQDAVPTTRERRPANRAPEVVIMQKAVRPEHVRHYLDGGYDLVAGHVHRVEDVAAMTTPEALVNGLGLLYEGSPFTPADEEIFLIRWPAAKPALFRQSQAPVDGAGVPGFRIESQRLPHGAGLYRLAAGTESLVASYDADLRRWLVKLPGGSG
ncbi:TY-Chap domain-containing protein [Actinomadura sp. 3N508]|uniref:SseB family protein n=1 Tax=Actinomadura sp. 3N508 TaxID=3375153 RepID=UPI003790F74F